MFEGKTVTIFGGGDSALDWAVELSKNSKVNLIHRRDEFRGAQATVDKVRQLAKEGKMNLLTKFQMIGIKGENKLVKNFLDSLFNLVNPVNCITIIFCEV